MSTLQRLMLKEIQVIFNDNYYDVCINHSYEDLKHGINEYVGDQYFNSNAGDLSPL